MERMWQWVSCASLSAFSTFKLSVTSLLLVGHGYHLDTAVLFHRKLNLNLRQIFLKKHPKGYNPPWKSKNWWFFFPASQRKIFDGLLLWLVTEFGDRPNLQPWGWCFPPGCLWMHHFARIIPLWDPPKKIFRGNGSPLPSCFYLPTIDSKIVGFDEEHLAFPGEWFSSKIR